VLGAQAVGGRGVDKRIDVVAACLHFGGTIDDLAGLDLAYAPPFGAAKDPLHIAAFVAQNQADGLCPGVAPGDPADLSGQILDVRTEAEIALGTLDGAIRIPISELRARLDELDRGRPVYVLCGVGQRAYNAARILKQNGFAEVFTLSGGFKMWQHSSAVHAG
jgi:rhodanese-related sulfurtransferase